MSYNLFLDDARMPHEAIYWELVFGNPKIVNNPELPWRIVRTHKDFVGLISKEGLPTTISFDHDLSKEHYPDGYNGLPPRYDEYMEKTGYDSLKWLVEYCQERKVALPKCYCHSFNVIGRENIFGLIQSYNKWFSEQETQV